MDQVDAISTTARGAQPNTALTDATISMAGYTVGLKDTRDYYRHDIRFIITVTLSCATDLVALLVRLSRRCIWLLRGHFVFIGSGYWRSGISIHTRQHLHWSVPASIRVLSGLGDYNLLSLANA